MAGFANRSALLTARDAWCADPVGAALVYGPIASWDVTAVLDLSRVFCATANTTGCNADCVNFDEDISAWSVTQVTSFASAFDGSSLSECHKAKIHAAFFTNPWWTCPACGGHGEWGLLQCSPPPVLPSPPAASAPPSPSRPPVAPVIWDFNLQVIVDRSPGVFNAAQLQASIATLVSVSTDRVYVYAEGPAAGGDSTVVRVRFVDHVDHYEDEREHRRALEALQLVKAFVKGEAGVEPLLGGVRLSNVVDLRSPSPPPTPPPPPGPPSLPPHVEKLSEDVGAIITETAIGTAIGVGVGCIVLVLVLVYLYFHGGVLCCKSRHGGRGTVVKKTKEKRDADFTPIEVAASQSAL